MSRVLEATCENGIVKVGDLEIPGAVVMSEGVGSSTGLLIIEGDDAHYVGNVSDDLESTITQAMSALEDIASALTTIATTLTSIGAGMTGPTTAPPPTLATSVLSITTKVTEITAARTALETLKGELK